MHKIFEIPSITLFLRAFCAFLCQIKHLFRQLLKKAISMALWTKAGICDKVHFASKSCQEHQAGKNIISVNPVILSNFSSCSSCLRGEIIREISVNPWLIKDLRVYKALYICRETFTDVMSPLQIRPFMQNKPNFLDALMNVTSFYTVDYEIIANSILCENKPNTNPIQTQSKPISPPHAAKQTQFKPNQTQFLPPQLNIKLALNFPCRGFLKLFYSYFQTMRGNLLEAGQLPAFLLTFVDAAPDESLEDLWFFH